MQVPSFLFTPFTHLRIPAPDICYVSHTGIPLFDDHLPLNRGDVIEIQGHASCGKSHLLYHFLLSCILPPAKSSMAPSRGMSAILYDLDSSFNILRFCNLLSTRISHLFPLLDDEKHTELKQASLSRLHIFRPKSLSQLAISLKYLPSYHASHIQDNEIGLVAIDSISAFYWPERLYEEQLRNFALKKKGSRTDALHLVLTAISDIIHSHAPLVLLSNWGLHTVSQDRARHNPSTWYKQHLRSFPVLQHAAPFDDRTAARSTEYPLNLAHHISLSSLSSLPCHASTRRGVWLGQEPPNGKGVIEDGHRVVCLVTSSGVEETNCFQLLIDKTLHIQSFQLENEE
ncbi:hypothetical protein J3A83DRAFT_3348595 [Scleroderma citrinum]